MTVWYAGAYAPAYQRKTVHQQIGIKLNEETGKVLYFEAQLCMVLKIRRFGK